MPKGGGVLGLAASALLFGTGHTLSTTLNPPQTSALRHHFQAALAARATAFAKWDAERTDAYRVFHGAVEGVPGLVVDRYGPTLLFQTFRDSLGGDGETESEAHALAEFVLDLAEMTSESAGTKEPLIPILSHRGNVQGGGGHQARQSTYQSLQALLNEGWLRRHGGDLGPERNSESLLSLQAADWGQPGYCATVVAHERGCSFDATPRPGQDPGFYLDFRVAREWLTESGACAGKDVLNAFSYTGTAAVCALKGGARAAVNLDFSSTALSLARANAERNGLGLRQGTALRDATSGEQAKVARAMRPPPRECPRALGLVRADALPALRQIAGLPAGGRAQQSRGGGGVSQAVKFESRGFGVVVLDPPTFAASPFGAVDIVRDYQTLLKPAALIAARGGSTFGPCSGPGSSGSPSPSNRAAGSGEGGGMVLATNHVSGVLMEDWLEECARCCAKAGVPLRQDPEVLTPHAEDFPTLDDGRSPLKIAILRV